MNDLRERIAASLSHTRRIASELRARVADIEARLGADKFQTSSSTKEVRMLLACIEADVERQSVELLALETIVVARTRMGERLQNAFREIHGCELPHSYVFPVPIPN